MRQSSTTADGWEWRTPPPSLTPWVTLPRAGRFDLGLAALCEPSKNCAASIGPG